MASILDARSFVCHKKNHLQCAGHMLIKGNENEFVNLANRLNIKLKLTGKELVFDSYDECIEHHGDD